VFRAKNLGHHYHGGDWLFRGLDLRVEPGEILAVLGPNARGKTTLLTCLAGIRQPKEGEVQCAGSVGYVPQNHGADHPFEVIEMVVMGRARHIHAWSRPSKEDMDAAWGALEDVGMADVGHRSFAALSGGQRQLVLIARAMVSQPTLIIMDEPASALDLRNQRLVLSVIDQLAHQGVGLIMTTHDPSHALHVATRTVLMDEEVTTGPSSELLTGQVLSQLYRTPICTACVMLPSGERTIVVPDLLAKEMV
jgi:iron complex transport system ATP-binding protein